MFLFIFVNAINITLRKIKMMMLLLISTINVTLFYLSLFQKLQTFWVGKAQMSSLFVHFSVFKPASYKMYSVHQVYIHWHVFSSYDRLIFLKIKQKLIILCL